MFKFAIASLLVIVAATAPAPAETSLTAAGSNALLPLFKAAAEAYHAAHPDVSVSVSGGGSLSGIARVAAKEVDLAMSDVPASEPDLVDHRVAVVAFSVVTNPDAGVRNVTRSQLRDIFAGKISNWKDVGGADLAIVVIERPRNSETRALFDGTFMSGVPLRDAGRAEEATATAVAAVRATAGAVSYASFGGTKIYAGGRFETAEGIGELSIDGVAPSEENVANGSYPFWTFEHVYTNGPAGATESRFIAFAATRSSLLRELGFIPIATMKR